MKKKLIILIFGFGLASCRTYYDKVQDFHTALSQGNYKAAEKDLLSTRFLNKKRNEILRYLELGKVFHLQQLYDSSNHYLNMADLLMEESNRLKDASTAVLINEAVTRYRGEDFERVLVNYYKALNYLYLDKNEDALVEAKRINIRLNELSDKQLLDGRKYRADAFAHTLQGFVYERLKDYNNAFISYRNAYELYAKDSSNTYLGAELPWQLKVDLINMAHKSGFYTERNDYCTRFNLSFDAVKDTSDMRLLFIWENGLAPIKQQEQVMLYLVKGLGGQLMFSNKNGDINIPFILPDNEKNKSTDLGDFNFVRIAYPTYVNNPLYYTQLSVQSGSLTFSPGLAENITHIANQTLKERFLKDMATTVSRIALKKIAEAELKKNKDTEVAGAIIGLMSALLEKADTRNWQSLPAQISYMRVPITRADTSLCLQLTTGSGEVIKDTLRIKPKSSLEIINYSTLQHLAPDLLNR